MPSVVRIHLRPHQMEFPEGNAEVAQLVEH